jgi:hypothetical protein
VNLDLTIIIVSYNVRDLLKQCVKYVLSSVNGIKSEIIVIDNASNDGSVEEIRESFPDVRLVRSDVNLGFARANNQAYAISRGNFILLLNPDTVVTAEAIRGTLEFMKSTPDAGMAGCRLVNPDGSLQKSVRRFPSVLDNLLGAFFLDRCIYGINRSRFYYRDKPARIDYCTGAFMMVRREAVGDMPLLNAEYFMYAEEKDFALRLKEKGWRVYFVPWGDVVHYGEQSTRVIADEMFLELQRSQLRYFSRHFKGWHRKLMIWSYWFRLLTSCAASFPLAGSGWGRHRFRLFLLAARSYPLLVRTESPCIY